MNSLAYIVIACAAFWVALVLITPTVAAVLLIAGGSALVIVTALSVFRRDSKEGK